MASTLSVSTRTSAPFPLSYIALMVGVVTIVPLVGIGACSSMRCSPCSTITGFTSMAPPRFSMAGKAGMTAKVGSTFRSRW